MSFLSVSSARSTSSALNNGLSPSDRDDQSDHRAVRNVCDEHDEERAAAVVQHEEPWRFDQRDLVRGRVWRPNARVDDWEQHVDEHRTVEDGVQRAEERADPPPAAADDGKESSI